MAHDHGESCPCVAEHRPAVLEHERHHILPLAMGGDDVEGNVAWLCPTAHMNVHELMRAMFKAGRALSDYELQQMQERPVSRYAATLAREGYRRASALPEERP